MVFEHLKISIGLITNQINILGLKNNNKIKIKFKVLLRIKNSKKFY